MITLNFRFTSWRNGSGLYYDKQFEDFWQKRGLIVSYSICLIWLEIELRIYYND